MWVTAGLGKQADLCDLVGLTEGLRASLLCKWRTRSVREPLGAHESQALQAVTFLLLFTEDPAH